MKHIKQYFITGLVILLPLAVTLVVIGFIVNFLTQPFMGMVSSILKSLHMADDGFFFLSHEQVIKYTSKLFILILLFFVTIVLGMVMRWFFIRTAFSIGDKILHRIPVVNTVYKTTQDIIKTLFVSDKNSFKQVVMVPFPRPGVYALGLIARESPEMCSNTVGSPLVSVLIPTTPNPTTGFLLMYKKEELVHVDMKPEEAIKYIVSCGVVVPEQQQPRIQT
jgi:uncharacterized membrane protein